MDKLLKEVQADAQPLNSIVFYPGQQGYIDLYSNKAGKGAQTAAKTLTDAGWVKGSDGIFAKDGQRFSVTITHNQRPPQADRGEHHRPGQGRGHRDTAADPNSSRGTSTRRVRHRSVRWSSAPFKAEQPSIYIPKDQGGRQTTRA